MDIHSYIAEPAPPPSDGGKRETARIIMRLRILHRCRALMTSGTYRPSYNDVRCDQITKKAVRYHFPTVEGLLREALDAPTRTGILQHLMPQGPWPSADDCDRIVSALVFRSSNDE